MFSDVRPVTPPQDPAADSDKGKQTPAGERKITVANTDLLFKLFDNIGGDDKKTATVHIKRSR